MKIRNGFVSNSSSSSFACVGFEVENKNMLDLFNLLWPDCESVKKLIRLRDNPTKKRGCKHSLTEMSFCSKCGKQMWVVEDNNDYISESLSELKWELSGKNGFTYHDADYLGTDNDVVGVATIDTEGFSSQELDLNELIKKIEVIRTQLGINKDEPVKLFGGIIYD